MQVVSTSAAEAIRQQVEERLAAARLDMQRQVCAAPCDLRPRLPVPLPNRIVSARPWQLGQVFLSFCRDIFD